MFQRKTGVSRTIRFINQIPTKYHVDIRNPLATISHRVHGTTRTYLVSTLQCVQSYPWIMSKNVPFALEHVYLRELPTLVHAPSLRARTHPHTPIHTPLTSYANATDVRALNKIRCNDSIYKYLASSEHEIRRFKLLSPKRTVSRSWATVCVNRWK